MTESTMCLQSRWIIVYAYCVSFIGVFIFSKGFFPVKPATTDDSTFNDVPPAPNTVTILTTLIQEDFLNDQTVPANSAKNVIPPAYDKLVLLVIDAMRVDFVKSPHYSKYMPFLHNIILDQHAQIFTARAKAPTVTMPRLKALTTGSIPGYVDVIFNVEQSAELKEDNIISNMKKDGKKIVFYGDDTWIKLFPSSFLRKDGTTSFFVTDYTEVDDNVTRHLDDELHVKKDWDVMILHYLGLDHIGHLVGPTSSLMPPKLREMDSIIKTIYNGLKKENVLLVVTSDHGMSGHGSHGGTTTHEVETPLIFVDKYRSIGNLHHYGQVEQTDFATTISILMGLPIPRSSMGKVIPGALGFINEENKLHALQYNCHQLLSLLAKSSSASELQRSNGPLSSYRNGLQFHNAFIAGESKGSAIMFKSAFDNYISCLKAASELLTSNLASYNYGLMITGIGILALGLCAVLYQWARSLLLMRRSSIADHVSSRHFLRVLFGLFMGSLLHVATLAGSSFVEEEHQTWHFLTISTTLLVFAAFLRSVGHAETKSKAKESRAKTSSLYDAQISEGDSALRLRRDATKTKAWEIIADEAKLREGEDAVKANGSVAETKQIPEVKNKSVASHLAKSRTRLITIGFLCVLCHRILRSWNQTGVKYAEVPDVGDWLTAPENKVILSFASFFALSSTAVLLECFCMSKDIVRTLVSMCGFSAVYWFRLATGVVEFPFHAPSLDMGLLESRTVFLCVVFLLSKALYHRLVSFCSFEEKRRKTHSCSAPRLFACSNAPSAVCKSMDCFQAAVVLLSALLLRPHNHSALLFNLFMYLTIYRLLWPVVVEKKIWFLERSFSQLRTGVFEEPVSSTEGVTRIILAYWFGQMAYFTFGNSNSFATVDLSAAYIGLAGSDGFINLISAGFLGLYCTYLGPILWITMCVTDVIKARKIAAGYTVNKQASSSALVAITSTISTLRLFTLVVYVAVATGHRYHLFIWSVFSPKLLYELASTAVHGVLIVSVTLLW